jgi:hypothetical protein
MAVGAHGGGVDAQYDRAATAGADRGGDLGGG